MKLSEVGQALTDGEDILILLILTVVVDLIVHVEVVNVAVELLPGEWNQRNYHIHPSGSPSFQLGALLPILLEGVNKKVIFFEKIS